MESYRLVFNTHHPSELIGQMVLPFMLESANDLSCCVAKELRGDQESFLFLGRGARERILLALRSLRILATLLRIHSQFG